MTTGAVRSRAPLLAIESSCDETAAAILDGDGRVIADVVHSQTAAHAPYGGVVPEIASREHVARIAGIVDEALRQASLAPQDLGAVAATYGPGLVGALMVGLSFGKGMAQALSVPFIGVHHIEGHLMAASIDPSSPQPPFIGLVASGGHTALYRFEGPGRATTLGQTRDDAAGEAFDKAAKQLGLGYPGGALIDARADEGDAQRFALPVSLRDRSTYDFSFSGLKTAVRLLIEDARKKGALDEAFTRDLCASLRRVIVLALVNKAMLACRRTQVHKLVLGGGVAANSLLRSEMARAGPENDVVVYVPPKRLCTDNAVMIAAAARAYWLEGRVSALSLAPAPAVTVEDAGRAAEA